MKGIKFKKHNEDYYSRPLYEVGDLYITTKSENPSSRFGGTWELYGPGRTLVCVDTSQTEFNVVKKTGGEKTHTLSLGEMPKHTHTAPIVNPTDEGFLPSQYGYNASEQDYNVSIDLASTLPPTQKGWISGTLSNYKGGNQAHNNLQPFITCYVWIRTA